MPPGEEPEDIDTENFLADETAESAEPPEDEDITLDLDTLDIPLDETDEIQSGEALGEDEKITLEDAGLTIEELSGDEIAGLQKDTEDEEEDIKLSIDDIDPSLSIENIETELQAAEPFLMEEEQTLLDEDDDLPDIDFESFEEEYETAAPARAAQTLDDDRIDIDFHDQGLAGEEKSIRQKISDTVPGGSVTYSVDYSISYSRTGALLRLFQIFTLGMIPHFIVFLLYSVLSFILGFINHLVVLSTRQTVEDFSDIQENTVRYFLSINAALIGIVEDMPVFAGRENIDYPLQMNITQPYRRSPILALLRLSIAGILILALPHILILAILSVVIPFIYFIGVISVLITGRWPYVLFDFLVRYYRHAALVMAFIIGLTDRYPGLKFD